MRRRRAKSATLEPTNSSRDKTSARIVQQTGSPIREVNQNAKNVAAQQRRKRAKRFVQSAMLERSCSTNLRKDKTSARIAQQTGSPTREVNRNAKNAAVQQPRRQAKHFVQNVKQEHSCLRKRKFVSGVPVGGSAPTERTNVHSATLDTTAMA